MKMQKVLILGGSKFIGKAIVDVLKDKYQIFLLNRGSNPIHKTFQITANRENKLDILKDYYFDFVIDISGMNRHHLLNTLPYINTKKYLFISSSAVYDIDNRKAPFNENDEQNINSIWTTYGYDKIEAEKLLIQSKIPYIIIRPPYIYGDNNYVAREGLIINELEKNHPIFIPKANNKIQFIYVYDLAKIIFDLMENSCVNEIFNVGNDIFTFEDWVKKIGEAINIKPQIIKIDDENPRSFFPFYPYDNYLNTEKINKISNHHTDFIAGINGYIKSNTTPIIKESVKEKINSLILLFSSNK